VEENLLGHLLTANDAATTREVERRLATDPVAVHDLAALRAALAPLEAAREEYEPPTDLWKRTLARVAEHIVATEGPTTRPGDAVTDELIRQAAAVAEPATPGAATIVPAAASAAGPPPARRRSVVAVLGLSLAVLALVFPVAVHLRAKARQDACQDTMREFYVAAATYSEHHNGEFPKVADGQPAATAADALKVYGYLPDEKRLTCPAARPEESAPVALANYAYSLGFRDESGQLQGLDRRPGSDVMPILADAPIRSTGHVLPVNHRRGQNVLFAGGNVRFCTTATVGVGGDDIFTNARGEVGAGLYRLDCALGRPEEIP
jgi:hypothetical protein